MMFTLIKIIEFAIVVVFAIPTILWTIKEDL